jgi:monooxygenase
LIKAGMFKEVESVMSEEEFDKHFSPPYNPWQQRFCLAPGGDFFAPIRDGKASIVTGHIETFTEKGIKMKSGEHIDADMIISATGLTMQQNFPFSTIKVTVDGAPYKAADHLLYNAMMVSDVPNFAFIVGYTNASWTLKADIAALYFTKLLNHMRNNKIAKVVPKEDPEGEVKRENFSGGLTSGYFARSGAVMPKQGDKFPWKGGVNYILDLIQMTFGGLSKDGLHFEVNEKKNL